MVFTMLGEMVEEAYGVGVWNDLINEVKPASEGAYVSAATYPDEEMGAFVMALSRRINTPVSKLLVAFGQYLFPKLAQKFPVFMQKEGRLYNFILTLNDIIHMEVRKLYPEAALPHFEFSKFPDGRLGLEYHSPRKMCFLAEGLLLGAAEYYGESIDVNQTACLHQGDKYCFIEVKFT